jgi:hypothetical protein
MPVKGIGFEALSGQHAHVVTIGTVAILFSYGDPVAFHLTRAISEERDGSKYEFRSGYYFIDRPFTKTTANDVHSWTPHDAMELTPTEFEARLRLAVRNTEI